MAISAFIGALDDPIQAVMRFMGRQTSGTRPLEYQDPVQMIAALNNPATESAAVARMHRMHYGSFYSENKRTLSSGLAERELLKMGTGHSGVMFGRPMKGFSVGMAHFKGALPFVPIQAFGETYMAPRGHKMSGLIGGASKALFYAAGDLAGTFAGGPVVGFALGMMAEHLGGYVEEGVQMLHDFNRSVKHINMGGNYEDSAVAYTMRQRAAQEMGSSVMNARQWLGQEALLLHQ
jgi:hypothetical protein